MVQVSTLAPNAPATASLAAQTLMLGIPAGQTGSYLHKAVGSNAPYAANDTGTSVVSCSFVGVAKPAIILITFGNADNQTFNQSDVLYKVVRSDGQVFYDGGTTLAHAGNTYPVSFMCIDPLTSTSNLTYSLVVRARTGGLGSGGAAAAGTALNPVMAILEIVN